MREITKSLTANTPLDITLFEGCDTIRFHSISAGTVKAQLGNEEAITVRTGMKIRVKLQRLLRLTGTAAASVIVQGFNLSEGEDISEDFDPTASAAFVTDGYPTAATKVYGDGNTTTGIQPAQNSATVIYVAPSNLKRCIFTLEASAPQAVRISWGLAAADAVFAGILVQPGESFDLGPIPVGASVHAYNPDQTAAAGYSLFVTY